MSVPLIGVFLAFSLLKTTPVQAATGINQTINFQGRLLNNQGATVPDGFYNIEFKIYQDGDGQSTGDSTGSPAGSLKWTEDWLNSSHGVKVVNGYLSVQLGTLTPFGSSINWNQSVLWLSMQIGNTSACTITTSFQANCGGDGEMTPMQPMTAAPYALNAGQLGGLTSTNFVQLAQGVQTDTSSVSSIGINKTGGSGDILQLQKSSADVLAIDNSGTALFRPASDSTTALQVQNRASGFSVFTVDTSGNRVVLGQASNLTGKLAFATAGGGTLTINPTSSASNFTITFPGETGTVCTTATSGTCNTAGGLSNVAYLNQDQTFSGKNAFSHTGSTSGDYAVALTGTPAASSTSSLLRLGNTITAGNGAVNGGTFISINESSSGAGSAADFLNLQNGTTVELQLTAGGNLTVNGTYDTNTFNNNTLGFGGNSAATISSSGSNNLTVDTGSSGGTETLGNNAATTNIGTSNAAHTIGIGTGGGGTTTQAITIGEATNSSSSLALQGGNGSAAISLLTGNNGTTAGGIQIGNTTGAFGQTISIGNNNNAANVVQIGTGTTQDSVTIGDTTTATSAVNIKAGSTGGITLGANTTVSGSNTFATGSGAVSLNGDTTVAGSHTLTVGSGTTSLGGHLDTSSSIATKTGTDFATNGPSNNVNFGDVSLVRLTGTGAQTITGIANGRDGYILTIVNAGSVAATFTFEDTNSTALNRIAGSSNISVPVGTTLTLIYDGNASRWRAGSGDTTNLQTAYNNSSTPQITLASGLGGLVVQDATSPIGAALFTVQANGGGAYFNVNATTVAVTDNLTVSGTYNTNTFNSTSLQFGGASGSVSSSNGNLTIQAAGTNFLLLDTAGAGSVKVGDSNAANVYVATSNIAHNIHIGDGGTSTAQTITIGSTGATAGAVTISAGASGSITLAGNTSITSSNTFSTGSGAVGLNGDTTIASGKNFTQSGGGSFSTGTGTNSLNGATTVASGKSFTANGSALFKINSDTTSAFLVQNSSTRNLLNIDTSGDIITVGNTTDGSQITLGATGNVNSAIRKNMSVTGTVNANDLVQVDTANDGKVTQAVAGSSLVFGIATATVTNAPDDIVISGVYQVNADATALAPGDLLVSSSTAGKVTKAGSTVASGTVLGRALSTKASGAGLVWAVLTLGVGGSDSLQTAYNNSIGGTTPEIKVDSATHGGVDIQDADSTIGGSLLTVRASNGSGLGAALFDVQSTGAITLGTATQTATIKIGQSAANNTVSIGDAAGNGGTQIITIGTSSTVGSITNITIGSTVAGSTTIQSGTTNINSATIATNQSTVAVFNSPTNVTEYQAATSISIGATTGTLTVRNANQTFGNAAGSGTFTNNGATLYATDALGDLAAGAIGSAATTVDIYTSFSIAPTASARAYTINAPTANTAYGRTIYISNIASAGNYFTINSIRIPPGSTATLVWSHTNGADSWQFAGAGGASIENQNSADQTAVFRISGTGQSSTSFLSPVIDSISGSLGIGSANATSINIGNTGSTPTTTVTIKATTGFQVQNSSSANALFVDTTSNKLEVLDQGGGSNYALIYYASGTANYTASSGTVAVGTGAGAITVTAGSGAAVNITANAASTWKTTAGTLTLQSGSGTSDFLILNAGGSNQVQVNGSAVVKLGSASADPTCTNGAIYYNTTTPQLRGCVNGTWNNLASITPTLQTTYTASTGSTTPEIKLDTTRGGVDIQDADSTIGGVLFAVRGSNAAGLGTALFNVTNASSNNVVQIGSSSGHSTGPVVLALDNYANSGADPTSTINGSIYYNGTKNKFRCYENGSWVDCINGPAENATTYNGPWAATTAKSANNIIYITPIYLSGQLTVNNIRADVTTLLGAAGDVGIYDSGGNLVLNGGSSSLTTGTGFKTITPTQSNKTLEAGQYYAAITWNSTSGVVAGTTILSGQMKWVGTLATGGLVLPSTITLSSITQGTIVPGITIDN